MNERHALLSVFLCLGLGARASAANLIVKPGLESAETFGWRGASATVEPVKTDPHSGVACLHVTDASGSQGQGNSQHLAVRPGWYYVEAWVRVDPVSPGLTTFDVQFFDAKGSWERRVLPSGLS